MQIELKVSLIPNIRVFYLATPKLMGENLKKNAQNHGFGHLARSQKA